MVIVTILLKSSLESYGTQKWKLVVNYVLFLSYK